jgi:hypothetical protein
MPCHPDRVRRHYLELSLTSTPRIGDCLCCQRRAVPLGVWMPGHPEIALCTRCWPRPPRLVSVGPR